MKKFTFLFSALIALFLAMPVVAQDRNNEDEVVKVDSRRRDYREGEVLVKFKPTSRVNVRAKNGRFQTSAVSAVDAALEALGVDTVDQLMPLTGRQVSQRRMRAANGAEVVDTDMSKLYRMKFNREKMQSVHEAIETLKVLPEVEYAEPNYIVYALSTGEFTDSATCVAEPLYNQQYGLPAINVPYLWNKPKVTTKRSVIAILDTGVDTEHPDLEGNIWTNEAEANGAEEQDDDGNGFKDDLHGWDFVNQTANVRDFNGHGTHCAGIAAAVGNNGIGITGANPDALIMPIAILQSDGIGDVATIIKGIDYATANGADVLSMSFGGYQHSIAEEQALAKAYAKMVLVAAAGNDHVSISDVNPCFYHGSGRPFPAAFTFVLAVEAGDEKGKLASFSNYDPDGPFYSEFGEEQLYNYELRAPGVGIMSTYPKGQYKSLNGTSMACPLVAGAISALLERKEYASKEILFGDLIYTRKLNGYYANVDFKEAYNITDEDRKPELSLVSYAMVDSVGGDGDGSPDAGDTISFYPILRNFWGQAENIKMTLEVGELEDPEIVNILDSVVEFGRPLSSYAKNRSVNPIRFVVNPNCVDGRHIKLLFKVTCDNAQNTIEHNFVIVAENGVEIGGIISDNTTLYPNVHYIVTSKILIPKDVTLTIMPGTVLRFKNGGGIKCEGSLVAQGTPDSMIVFKTADLQQIVEVDFNIYTGIISYVEFNNLRLADANMQQCEVKNSIMEYCTGSYFHEGNYSNNKKSRNVIKNSTLVNHANKIKETYTNIINNETLYNYFQMSNDVKNCNIFSNSFTKNSTNVYFSVSYNSSDITTLRPSEPSYLGSAKEGILRNYIIDYSNPVYSTGYGQLDINYVAKEPIRETHGIVWKVLVNGYDAQDEFEQLPPLGVGKHKFEVYFNRPMDTNFTPFIAMGVRPPYTQNRIAEEGSWNDERTVYTAYLTITGKSHIDGLNRIYVSDAVESVEDYYIRKEAQELLFKIGPLLNEIVNVPVSVTLQTSNSSKDGYLTALNKTSYKCSLLFDGRNTTSSNVDFYKDEYLQIDLGVDKNIRYFRFNYQIFSVYNPNKIIVQGSNDGITFENVDSFSNLDIINPLSMVSDGSWQSLIIDALIPYRYYRFYFDNSIGRCILAEFGIEVLEHMVKDDYLNFLPDEYAFNVLRNNIIAEYDLCRVETRDNKLLQTTLERLYIDYNKLASVLGYQSIDHTPIDVPSAPEWVIPVENLRFNVEVAAAGSMATGLMAEAGLGNVKLTWETDEEDFEDLLGYNIYRFTIDTAGVSSDSIIINTSLIDSKETEFVDYDVVPGETYYYIIKQMTTSLSSYSLSNPVAATPLTASKGDANGSMTVDVADVVTQVAWLTNQNPQPFIFEAADVNGDGVVNILDVVATINIIMNPSSAGIMSVDNTATYYIENGILYVETPVALGGVQFSFVADKDAEIKPLAALNGFEKVTNWISDTELMFMAYSMSGKTISAGRHALLEIGDAELSSIVLSDTQGHNVMPINGTTTNLGVVEQMQLSAPYPNPFREQVVVPYLIGQSGEHAVRMVFTDVAGRTIDVYTTTNDFGSYSYTWTPAEGMLPGVYFVSLYVDNKLMQTSKIVYIQ